MGRRAKGEGRKQKRTVHLLTAAGRYSVKCGEERQRAKAHSLDCSSTTVLFSIINAGASVNACGLWFVLS